MPKTITIRRSLVTHLALVVLGLGLAIILMMALSTRRVIRTLSESLIDQTSRRTELKLRSFFEPVSHQVGSLRSWGEAGELHFDRLRQIPLVFEQLLVEFPYCSAVYLADENDREIFLTRSGSNSVALGMFPAIQVEVPDPITFESGDIYATISDGIFEATAPGGEEMGTDRVTTVIREHRAASAADIIDHIRAATDTFTEGAPPDDDRTIILIKRT